MLTLSLDFSDVNYSCFYINVHITKIFSEYTTHIPVELLKQLYDFIILLIILFFINTLSVNSVVTSVVIVCFWSNLAQ